jgi:hypothetical protein
MGIYAANRTLSYLGQNHENTKAGSILASILL